MERIFNKFIRHASMQYRKKVQKHIIYRTVKNIQNIKTFFLTYSIQLNYTTVFLILYAKFLD